MGSVVLPQRMALLFVRPFLKELDGCHDGRARSIKMTDVPGYHRHVCVKRHFNEREIAWIGNGAGHGNRRDKPAFPANKGNDFVHCIIRKRELFSMKHIRIFIEYPCVEYQTNITVDHKVENFGGGPMRREQP